MHDIPHGNPRENRSHALAIPTSIMYAAQDDQHHTWQGENSGTRSNGKSMCNGVSLHDDESCALCNS